MSYTNRYFQAHNHGFHITSDHALSECFWCSQARDTALEHMRDANLKTTKSTKYEPDDTPHVVHLTRLGRDDSQRGAPAVNPCDLSDDTLRNVFATTQSNWDRAMIEEVVNLRIKLSRQRPVVLDLEEGEAALLLGLLNEEVDAQGVKGDFHYQNGDGFEAECAQARGAEREAEALAERLRKLLGKHLDKAYAGELES